MEKNEKVHLVAIVLKLHQNSTTGRVLFECHMQSSNKRGKKVYIFRLGHITKMPAMPIYVKSLKKILQNHTSYCREIWYVASRELVL